jgi:hypothetical protein
VADGAGGVPSPVPEQQLLELVGGMIGDAGQDVGQPGLRIDVVELGGDDQAVHEGRALPIEAVLGLSAQLPMLLAASSWRAGGPSMALRTSAIRGRSHGRWLTAFRFIVTGGEVEVRHYQSEPATFSDHRAVSARVTV